MEQIELLPQLLSRIFKRRRVVSPICKARGDWQDDRVYERHLPNVFENLYVFIILNTVTEVLQPYPWS